MINYTRRVIRRIVVKRMRTSFMFRIVGVDTRTGLGLPDVQQFSIT